MSHRTHNPYKMAAAGQQQNNNNTTNNQQDHQQQHQPPQNFQQQNPDQQQQYYEDDNNNQQQVQSQQQQQPVGIAVLPNLLDVPAQYHELTLHKPLIGKVSFVPYPKTEVSFDTPAAASEADDPHVRIFIGQLPYGMTEMQIQWMAQILGGGVVLYDPEVIVKNGKKTGCVHARVRDSQLKQLVAGMHKRILVDDSGLWVGRTPAEIATLTQYVAELKADPKKRYPDRPYDTVVVQNATSARQQFHQGLPTLQDYFNQFASEHGIYGPGEGANHQHQQDNNNEHQ